MNPVWFTSPAWWHAFTVAERTTSLSGSPTPAPGEYSGRARQRLERWRAQPPFTDDTYYIQRLAQDGIAPEHLLWLLDEPVESLQRRLPEPPRWLTQLVEAYSRPLAPFDNAPDNAPGNLSGNLSGNTSNGAGAEEAFAPGERSPDALEPDTLSLDDLVSDDLVSDDGMPDEDVLGFLEIVRPLIDQACDQLQDEVNALAARYGALPFDPETIEDLLLVNLPDPLLLRLSRTLVLELHVARLRGLLAGDTPQQRFQSFVEYLADPENALAILSEYPVLMRQLVLCINHWADVSLEFLTRLCADWETLRRCFCPDHEPGELVELIAGAGDTHRGGRSVMIAEFASGFRVVYKPKSMAIDLHFQELLAWFNGRGCQPPLYTLKVLDCREYGWVEFITRQGCRTKDEVARFYQRHGAYLALLYALNANDFHFENVIASGEHPVLIDLETLLQPRFDSFDETYAEVAATKVMVDSVLQVGLLPARIWSSEEFAGIDISGLGGASGQLSPDRLPQLMDVGTDAMHYVRQQITLSGDSHRPTLNDAEIHAADYLDDVIAGFEQMYRLLVDAQADLLAEEGPLNWFAQDEIRILLRQTRTYDQLLFESFHPDMLRDALERDQFLDRLWVGVPARAYLARVIKAEQADLQAADIPLFTTHPSTLDLFGARGERIAGVLFESGMATVRRRLQQLSEQDLNRQKWFIQASFATVGGGIPPRAIPPIRQSHAAAPLPRARLLAAAKTVADHLLATAVDGTEDISWIGLGRLDAQNWEIRPVGIDLAGGIPGIALFLAYAGDLLDAAQYTEAARRAQKTLRWQIDLLRTEMPVVGALEGWGGVLYTLTHLAALWNDKSALAQAEGIVDLLAELVGEDDRFDVARGTAGALLSLLAFYRCAPTDQTRRVALACGDHLLASARPQDRGVSWPIPDLAAQPHSGLWQGNRGIAWALMELAAATGNEHYRATAAQALDHERSTRPLPEMPSVETGLATLSLHRHLQTAWLRDELQMAVSAAQSWRVGSPHALQGGAMACLDLLQLAEQRIPGSHDRAPLDTLTTLVVESIERYGWLCGGPSGIESPGLMLGLAGIGYQLLRLAEPQRVPSVLALDPPARWLSPTGSP
jgi:type 2 lantibiotic biosynthesis protein LanM